MQGVLSNVTADYGVIVNPDDMTLTVPNGVFISPTMTATVYNGVGPFEYEWTYSSEPFDGSLANPTPDTCQAYIPRFNTGVNVAVICTVTDTGNANAETASFCRLDITFE